MFLTVLTPTFNRSNLLRKVYDSLCKQMDKNFQWLIIDDGSTDDTEEAVLRLKENNPDFRVDYYYKKNGGKHSALNYAHPYILGEFVMILDSDDYLVDNAIELVKSYWNKYKHNEKIGYLAFERGDEKGKFSCQKYLADEFVSNYIEYRVKYNIQGEQIEIYRTNVFKEVIFPEFPNENYLGGIYMHVLLSDRYDTVFIHKILCIWKYLDDGLTKAGRKLRIKNPLGGMIYGELLTRKEFPIKYRIKGMVLYIVYAMFAKKSILSLLKKCEHKFLFFVSLPLSTVLYIFWKDKYQ